MYFEYYQSLNPPSSMLHILLCNIKALALAEVDLCGMGIFSSNVSLASVTIKTSLRWIVQLSTNASSMFLIEAFLWNCCGLYSPASFHGTWGTVRLASTWTQTVRRNPLAISSDWLSAQLRDTQWLSLPSRAAGQSAWGDAGTRRRHTCRYVTSARSKSTVDVNWFFMPHASYLKLMPWSSKAKYL